MKDDLTKKRDELAVIVDKLKQSLRFDADEKEKMTDEEYKKLWQKMHNLAMELHSNWKPTPRHHKYMVKNRGCLPEDSMFYDHIHPVEDLIKFTFDEHANDDPEDQTLGDEFKFEIYTRRWGHKDTYKVIRNNKGWIFSHISDGVQSDKSGNPSLFELLDHDSVNYPEELPGYLEWLWKKAEEDGLSHKQLQKALNQLADWINVCEDNSPSGIWEYYK